ncbi:unnamed protein product [Schistosoma guineensis]|nr:unnamed protein product [Schistosoma guineensis]
MILWARCLGKSNVFPLTFPCRCNANRAVLCRTKRRIYGRTYPVSLVYPNGGSIRIRFHEPRIILQVSALKIIIKYVYTFHPEIRFPLYN